MSVSQVVQGALVDPAPDKHPGRSTGKAQKEGQVGPHSRRSARDGRPSFEAFERAQQREAGGAVRMAAGLVGRVGGAGDASDVDAEDVDASDVTSASAVAATSTGTGTSAASRSGEVGSAKGVGVVQMGTVGSGLGEAGSAGDMGVVRTEAVGPGLGEAGSAEGMGVVQMGTVGPGLGEAGSAEDMGVVQMRAVGSESDQTGRVEGMGVGDYARHYGSFPVLVAGQLVELDLYTLGQRTAGTSDSVRRLYLSLHSTGLGPVQVTAEASGSRLSVSVAGAAQAVPEVLNEHVRAVGELAARLGWKLESVEHAAELPGELTGAGGVGRADGDGRVGSVGGGDGLDRLDRLL
jgi:hypothetical protein